MLYETANQPVTFLLLLLVGFLCGFACDFFNFVWFECAKNKVIRFFCDIFLCILLLFLFVITCQKLCYGETRPYCLIAFFLGFSIQRVTLGKLLVKISMWAYVKINKFIKCFVNLILDKHNKKRQNIIDGKK